MKNAISWFEIPVKNFDRAHKFYSAIMGSELQKMEMPDGSKYGVFPYSAEENGVGGGIVETKDTITSVDNGPLLYINGGDDLAGPLAKVEGAGGKILMPKTNIGANGFMAQFVDTEGNKLALHSHK